MFTRRMLFAVLSVGLVGVGALAFNTRAEDQNASSRIQDETFRAQLILQKELMRQKEHVNAKLRTILNPSDGGLDFVSLPSADLQNKYVDLHKQIASNLSDDELKTRIADAEKEIGQTEALSKLRQIRDDLKLLQKMHPDSDAGKTAQRALEVIDVAPQSPKGSGAGSQKPSFKGPATLD